MNEKQNAEPTVTDFLDEFKDALFDQLISDYKRWGNTWLKRTKEGQELRTRKRFDDYFDQFEEAGTPVPWLKIVGGALICWIREQHPELCSDVNIDRMEEPVGSECGCLDCNLPKLSDINIEVDKYAVSILKQPEAKND